MSREARPEFPKSMEPLAKFDNANFASYRSRDKSEHLDLAEI